MNTSNPWVRFLLAAFFTMSVTACSDDDGNGVVPAYLEVTPGSGVLSSEVGGSDTLVLTVRNRKRSSVPLSLPSLPGDVAYEPEGTTCGGSIAAGSSCQVTLVFTPSSEYVEEFSFEVNDRDEDAEYPVLTLTLDSMGSTWAGVQYVHDRGPAEASAVARDQAGNMYLAGLSRELVANSPSALQGVFVTRYNRKGDRAWTFELPPVEGHTTWGPRNMVADGDQVCFTYSKWLTVSWLVHAYTTLQCLDARTGESRWAHALSEGDQNTSHRDQLALAVNGDLLVGDPQGAYSGVRTLHLYRYSSASEQLWHREYEGSLIGLGGLVATPTEIMFSATVTGDDFGLSLPAGFSSAVVVTLDHSGNVQWAVDLGREVPGDNVIARGLDVDASGVAYLSTWRTESNVSNPDEEAAEQVTLVSLAADGSLRWSRKLPLVGVGGYSHDVAVSPDGQRIAVGGRVFGGTGTVDVLPDAQGYSSFGGLLALYNDAGDLQWLDLLWTNDDGHVVHDDLVFAPGGDLLAAGMTHHYMLDGSDLPAGIVDTAVSGEIIRAGFLVRYRPQDMVD